MLKLVLGMASKVSKGRILILGGTFEARQLADHAAKHNWDAIVSLAGRTTPSKPTHLPLRIGGFGGSDGLAQYITDQAITLLLDATHPFATTISANAATAAKKTATPRLALNRPPWQAQADDNWQHYPSFAAMCQDIPKGAHVFIAGGQEAIRVFANTSTPDFTPHFTMSARGLSPPPTDLAPPDCFANFICGMPATSADDEARLFTSLAITHLIVKNAGGSADAKLIAARNLGIPVLLLQRPPPPPPPCYLDVASLLEAIKHAMLNS